MPEWLQRTFPNGLDVPLDQMFGRLIVAFFLGCGVAGIYRWTHRKDAAYSPTFVTTLVLMAVLVAVVTQVIGQNSARAFGLLGALAIVRFRTMVRDTRDTAFVVFAVVEGMAAGAGYLPIALAGFGIAAAAAIIMPPTKRRWRCCHLGTQGAGRGRGGQPGGADAGRVRSQSGRLEPDGRGHWPTRRRPRFDVPRPLTSGDRTRPLRRRIEPGGRGRGRRVRPGADGRLIALLRPGRPWLNSKNRDHDPPSGSPPFRVPIARQVA